MAINTARYKNSESKQSEFIHGQNKIATVISKSSDGSVSIYTIEVTITGKLLPRTRKRADTFMVRDNSVKTVVRTIKFDNIPGYDKYRVVVKFNTDTLEVTEVFAETK